MYFCVYFLQAIGLEKLTELETDQGGDGSGAALSMAKEHKAAIDRFGRFPHRNRLLGRESTPEELAWLAQPDLPGK